MQHDNAPAHVPPNDEDIVHAGTRSRCNIQLVAQPPNSPDFNVLDLGFFRAVQSLRYKKVAYNLQELVYSAEEAFWMFDPRKINDNFLTLQECLHSSMKVSGGNSYKLPHMKKHRKENISALVRSVECDRAIFNLATNLLHEPK